MNQLKAGIVARTIQLRRKRYKKIFSTGVFCGALGGMIVSRILFSIRCKRCKRNSKKQ